MPIVLKKPDSSMAKHLPDFTNPNFLKNIFKAVVDAADLKFGSAGKNLIEAAFAVSKIEDPDVLAYMLTNQVLITIYKEAISETKEYNEKGPNERAEIWWTQFINVYIENIQKPLEGRELTANVLDSPGKEIKIEDLGKGLSTKLYEQKIIHDKIKADNIRWQIVERFDRHFLSQIIREEYRPIINKLERDNSYDQNIKYYIAHSDYRIKIQSKFQAPLSDTAPNLSIAKLYVEPYFEIHRKCWNPDGPEYWDSFTFHDKTKTPDKTLVGSDTFIPVYKTFREERTSSDDRMSIHEFLKDWLKNQDLLNQHYLSYDSKIALVLGQPGQGKTSLAQRLVHDLLEEQEYSLHNKKVYLFEIGRFNAGKFFDNPRQYLRVDLKTSNPFRNLAVHPEFPEDKIRPEDFTEAVWILDGLDELLMNNNFDEIKLIDFFEKLDRDIRENDFKLHIIITSRTGVFSLDKILIRRIPENLFLLQLTEFSQEQQREWLKKYEDNASVRPTFTQNDLTEIYSEDRYLFLQEFLKQPLLLYSFVRSNISMGGKINKAQTLEKIFNNFVESAWDKYRSSTFTNISQSELRNFLGDIALQIWQSEEQYITYDSLSSFIEIKLSVSEPEKIKSIIDQVQSLFYFKTVNHQKSPKDGSRALQFQYKPWMEFLAADKIWRTFKEITQEKGLKSDQVLKYLYPTIAKKNLYQKEEDTESNLVEIIKNDTDGINEMKEILLNALPNLLREYFLIYEDDGLVGNSRVHLARNAFYNYWTVLMAINAQQNERLKLREGADELLGECIRLFSAIHKLPIWICNIDLTKINLDRCNLTGCKITDTCLHAASLKRVDFSNSTIEGTEMEETNLYNAFFFESRIIDSSFTQTELEGAKFIESEFKDVRFYGTLLEKSTFEVLTLKGKLEFQAVDLRNAFFNKVNNSGTVILEEGYMNRVIFKSSSDELESAQSLSYETFQKFNFIEQDLTSADFTESDLKDCSFTKSDLKYARFIHASLKDTSFRFCSLEGTNFERVDFSSCRNITYGQMLRVKSLKGATGLNRGMENLLRKHKPSLFQ